MVSVPTLNNLSSFSLIQQCKFLGLDIIAHKSAKKLQNNKWYLHDGKIVNSPEQYAFNIMQKEGYEGSFCEGGAILTLLKAASLNYLAKVNIFNERNDACTRYLEAQFTIYNDKIDKIISEIMEATEFSICNNFEEIYSYSSIRSIYPGLNSKVIIGIWKAIGRSRLLEIVNLFSKNPYTYRSGWPDLTLYKGEEILFLEVKTTDKLHKSQITIINEIINPIKLNCKVLRLIH